MEKSEEENVEDTETGKNEPSEAPKKKFKIGDFVDVKIMECTSATLIGEGINISKKI